MAFFEPEAVFGLFGGYAGLSWANERTYEIFDKIGIRVPFEPFKTKLTILNILN